MNFEWIEDEKIRNQTKAAYEESVKKLSDDFTKKMEAETTGLKTKVEELLGEKKTIQEKLATFGDITDPKAAAAALKFMQENEEAQMIQEGRFDEVVEKRTSQLRIETAQQLSDLKGQLEETAKGHNHYKGLYENKMRDDAIRAAAIKAGVRPEAHIDVLTRAANMFTLGKDGSVECRDEKGNLRKNEDGNVISPSVWIEGLKIESPHYWPSSTGAGARGGAAHHGAVDVEGMEALQAALDRGDMVTYRKLRAKAA